MPDDLFSHSLEERYDEFAPLAARMRPRNLDEFIGQAHIVGERGPLRPLIETDNLSSIILWGPPGTGKTSLASLIANVTKAHFAELSAVNASVADVRKVIADARDRQAANMRKTILFLDEIHRFNKAQQDALLPAVENRWIVLIGATTENPFFEINSPLMSRSLLFRLEPLTPKEIASIVSRAVTDEARGLGESGVTVKEEAVGHIVDISGGDARAALNFLEASVAAATARGEDVVDLRLIEEVLQQRRVRYDRKGDDHYDVISAFIKSMRGSDPDAALFWLARMLEAGEDPRFIARRLVIFASEDIGNADPHALPLAVSAFEALEFVGLPEAQLNLAQAVTYLATAEKSNASTLAIGKALEHLRTLGTAEVPVHLRGSPGTRTPGYKYPHDFPGGWVEQQYRPGDAEDTIYYEPTDRGAEKDIASRLARQRGKVEDGTKE